GSTTVCNELELLDCTNATIDTDFTATNSDTIVQFTNMSVGNAESYRWRFGDGGSSREENPNYTYATMGSYEVCLTAQNACGSYTFCDSVEVALNSGILIDVAGEIQMIDGQTMEDVMVSCGGLVDTTSFDGKYSLQTNARANCAVTPTKEDDVMNGLTTFDIILTRKHILRLELFESPYQEIAADVNGSGTVTSYDMVLMQRLVLGLADEFPSVPAWRFVPKDYEFPEGSIADFPETISLNNFNASRSDVDFVGVKMGDVNNSAVPNLQTNPTERSLLHSFLYVDNQQFVANEVIDVPIRLSKEASGFQFSLQLNDAVEILAVQSEWSDFSKNNFNINGAQQLTVAWWATAALAEEESVILNLKLRTKRAGKIADILKINSTRMQSELYTADFEVTHLDLQFQSTTPSFDLSILPNPAHDFVQINWKKQPQEAVNIQLRQLTGQLVKEWNANSEMANSSLNISDLESGVYFLTIKSGALQTTKKLVKK
ncbi:MAG: T9SS type A sorting domain-containing protein, partial [Saprospiraceae bacterium]